MVTDRSELEVRIVSVRVRIGTEERDVNITPVRGRGDRVDAVFVSLDAVNRILMEFYDRHPTPGMDVQQLRDDIQSNLKKDGWICVIHDRHCSSLAMRTG
jgi:hypothetical protein